MIAAPTSLIVAQLQAQPKKVRVAFFMDSGDECATPRPPQIPSPRSTPL